VADALDRGTSWLDQHWIGGAAGVADSDFGSELLGTWHQRSYLLVEQGLASGMETDQAAGPSSRSIAHVASSNCGSRMAQSQDSVSQSRMRPFNQLPVHAERAYAGLGL